MSLLLFFNCFYCTLKKPNNMKFTILTTFKRSSSAKCTHNVVQHISRTFSFCKPETPHSLNTKFCPRPSPWKSTFCFHDIDYFGYCIWMESCSVCHVEWLAPLSKMSSGFIHVTGCYFLWQHTILLYAYTTLSLSVICQWPCGLLPLPFPFIYFSESVLQFKALISSMCILILIVDQFF